MWPQEAEPGQWFWFSNRKKLSYEQSWPKMEWLEPFVIILGLGEIKN